MTIIDSQRSMQLGARKLFKTKRDNQWSPIIAICPVDN